jgi:hypothetical protein
MSWTDKLAWQMPEPTEPQQLRSFGFIVATGFAVIGLWPWVFRGHNVRVWSVVLSAFLAIPAAVRPAALRHPFRVWMLIGHCLGWTNTRIILSVLYLVIFTPVSLAMRLIGRDSMARGFEPNINSYRRLKAPRPASHLTQQF